MLRMRRTWFLPVILAGAVILGMPPPAPADFTLTLHEQGYSDLVIHDNGAGDLSTANGVIIFGGTFGTFSITAEIGSSNSATATAPAVLTINQLAIQSNDAGTGKLTITLTDTGFSAPNPGPALMQSQLSTTAMTGTGSVSFQSFLDGTGGTKLTLNTAPGGKNATDAVTIGGSPYTLSNVTTVTLSAGGTMQSTGITTVATPAPTGVELAVTGLPLLGVGLWLHRRRRRAEGSA